MVSIEWCLKIKRGIKIINPNENLSQQYENKAIETLKLLDSVKTSKSWSVSLAYYAMYYKTYSLLQKLGIKSEIHECTISVLEFLEKQSKIKASKKLKEMKQARELAQYYVDKPLPDINKKEVLGFFNKIDLILKDLNKTQIKKDLKELSNLANTENI